MGADGNKDRLGSIQALRAYAAISVIFGHTLLEMKESFGPNLFHTFPWTAGAHVFFVISGFIMAYTNARAFGTRGAAGKFIVRRLVRIVPLYWLFTTVLLLFLVAGNQVRSTDLELANAVASYLFWPYPRPDGVVVPLLSVGWTLNYEMFFYALFALGLLFRPMQALVGISVAMAVLALCHSWIPSSWIPLKFWSDPIILQFTAGMWLGHAHRRFGKALASAPAAVGGVMLALLGLALNVVVPFDFSAYNAQRVVTYGGPAILLVASVAFLLPTSLEQKIPSFVLLLGDASYALYLSHRFALRPIAQVGEGLGVTNGAAMVAAATLLCIAAGVAVHMVIERPMLRWFRGRRAGAIEVAP